MDTGSPRKALRVTHQPDAERSTVNSPLRVATCSRSAIERTSLSRGKSIPKKLPAGERLHDVDLAVGAHAVGEAGAVEDGFTVDEHRHVLAQGTLLIEHVGARPRVLPEDALEHLADGQAFDVRRRDRHVSLQRGGEDDVGHGPNHSWS